MNKTVLIAGFALLFSCSFLVTESMAAGFGLNITGGRGDTKWDADNHRYFGPTDNDFHFNTDNKRMGMGIIFDSAVGSRRGFNYRLNIGSEYADYKIKDVYRYRVNPNIKGTFETKGWFMSHDFGVKVFQRKSLRIWVGPEVRISKTEGKLDRNKVYDIDISTVGVGPVVGLNLNVGDVLSLAFKLGRIVMASYGELDNRATGEDWKIHSDTNVYYFTNVGIIFRFGENL